MLRSALVTCILAGCDPASTGGDSAGLPSCESGDDTFVSADIGGAAYEGLGRYSYWSGESSDPPALLFGGDDLTIYVYDWSPGESGACDLSCDEPLSVNQATLLYTSANRSWLSVSGKVAFEGWEEGDGDPVLGMLAGTFTGSLEVRDSDGTSLDVSGGRFCTELREGSAARR